MKTMVRGGILSFSAELVDVRIGETGEARVHLRNEFSIGLQCSTTRREAFEHLAHFNKLEKLAQRRNRQIDPAAGLDIDDPFLHELMQGEPQWRLADSKLLGDALLENARTGLDVSRL